MLPTYLLVFYVSIYQSTHLSIYRFLSLFHLVFFLFVCLSIYLSICLSIYLSCPSISLFSFNLIYPFYLPIHPANGPPVLSSDRSTYFLFLFLSLSFYLPIYLPIHFSACLFGKYTLWLCKIYLVIKIEKNIKNSFLFSFHFYKFYNIFLQKKTSHSSTLNIKTTQLHSTGTYYTPLH